MAMGLTPYSSKTWRIVLAKPLIPRDRPGGGKIYQPVTITSEFTLGEK
jgi:hypothetical protein